MRFFARYAAGWQLEARTDECMQPLDLNKIMHCSARGVLFANYAAGWQVEARTDECMQPLHLNKIMHCSACNMFSKHAANHSHICCLPAPLLQDWDILFLNMCYDGRGPAVGAHVKIAKKSLCTLGYVATPGFAHKVLSEVKRANLHLRTPVVDLLFCDLTEHWEVAAYVAAPPLANFSSVKSTMNYEDMWSNLTAWDHFWLGRRRLHGSV
jgi:hypothetical protein